MAPESSPGHDTAVLLDDQLNTPKFATCPMCHASTSVTQNAIEGGDGWRCVRCGQHWDSARLAAVASYAAWNVDQDRERGRGTNSSHGLAPYRDSPSELQDGRP